LEILKTTRFIHPTRIEPAAPNGDPRRLRLLLPFNHSQGLIQLKGHDRLSWDTDRATLSQGFGLARCSRAGRRSDSRAFSVTGDGSNDGSERAPLPRNLAVRF
jgi:hypothetical protein